MANLMDPPTIKELECGNEHSQTCDLEEILRLRSEDIDYSRRCHAANKKCRYKAHYQQRSYCEA